MSFFNKIFGGEKKPEKKAEPPKPQINETEAKKIKIQKACNDLDMKIKAFEDNQKKFEHKVTVLKTKAKELLEADKKKEAKKYVEEATKVQKQAESYTLRKKVLVDKKFQLEQAAMDMDTIDAVEGAQTHIKDQEKYSEKLEEIIIDSQQAKMQQQEINDKMKDLVGDQQDEDVDDMLNELMADVKKDKMKKVDQNKNVNVNAVNTNTNKQAEKNEKDEIEAMLNAL